MLANFLILKVMKKIKQFICNSEFIPNLIIVVICVGIVFLTHTYLSENESLLFYSILLTIMLSIHLIISK